MPAEALAPLDLADPRLGRLILRLGLPSVAGLAITALHHVANAFFVGLVGVDDRLRGGVLEGVDERRGPVPRAELLAVHPGRVRRLPEARLRGTALGARPDEASITWDGDVRPVERCGILLA